MSNTKEFFDLVSTDKDVKLELGEASLEALISLAAEKGLKDDAMKALEEVTAAIAEKHGFNLKAPEELSNDELYAIAGGSESCEMCIHLSKK